MKKYEKYTECPLAIMDAENGGQALFVHTWYGGENAPRAFRGKRTIGKLFDQDRERLVRTAHELGVRRVKVDREGSKYQHVDLVSGPLERAIALCE